jgi:Ca2+:H+ antiporter
VIPLLVVLGWMIGQPLSLDFQVFETVSLLLTVVMSSVILSTGKSDWLYGVMMIVAYIIIAGAFWLQKQPKDLK